MECPNCDNEHPPCTRCGRPCKCDNAEGNAAEAFDTCDRCDLPGKLCGGADDACVWPDLSSEEVEAVRQAVAPKKPNEPPRTKPTEGVPHERTAAVRDLLWEMLPKDPENGDRRQTGWGTKSMTGLVACVERVAAMPKEED